MKTLPEAFIFDMDGTLLDSEPYMKIARKQLYTRFSIPLEYEKNIRTGMHKSDYWSELKATYSLPYSVDELIQLEQDAAVQLIIKANVPTSTGLLTLLDFAKSNGIKIGCASSSIRSYVQTLLARLGIAQYFSAICCGDDQIKPKPAPDAYFTVCKKLDVNPKNCIAFEDSETGVIAALSAGLTCVGYREHTKHTKLSRCKLIIDKMDELIAMLK